MARLVILGATGRTGQEVVRAAKAAGHQVWGHGRRAVEGADRSLGGPFDGAELAESVAEADAVLSCLASTNSDPVCSTATRAVLAVARATPLRVLTIAGAGVDRPEDRKGVGDKAIGLIMRLTVGRMLADRQAETETLLASEARATVLRPPRLTSGAPTGRWTWSFDRPARSSIDRADLARAMLEALGREDLVGRAPFVAGARA